MASRVVATLPRIRATIGHIPQRLKTANIEPSSRARLEVSLSFFVIQRVSNSKFWLLRNAEPCMVLYEICIQLYNKC